MLLPVNARLYLFEGDTIPPLPLPTFLGCDGPRRRPVTVSPGAVPSCPHSPFPCHPLVSFCPVAMNYVVPEKKEGKNNVHFWSSRHRVSLLNVKSGVQVGHQRAPPRRLPSLLPSLPPLPTPVRQKPPYTSPVSLPITYCKFGSVLRASSLTFVCTNKRYNCRKSLAVPQHLHTEALFEVPHSVEPWLVPIIGLLTEGLSEGRVMIDHHPGRWWRVLKVPSNSRWGHEDTSCRDGLT